MLRGAKNRIEDVNKYMCYVIKNKITPYNITSRILQYFVGLYADMYT